MRFLCLFLFFNITYSQQNVRYAKIDFFDNPCCWGLLNDSFARYRYVINIKALDNDIYMLIDTKNVRRREQECSIPKHSIDNGYFLTINKQQVRFDKEELALDYCIPRAIHCSKNRKDTYVAIEMRVACYIKNCTTYSYIFVHLYDNKVKEVKAIGGELRNGLTDKKIKSYMSNNGFKFLK